MEKQQIQKALEELKKQSKKRKFNQSYDLILNLKGIDTKSTPLDFFVDLPYPSRKVKIAAFVGSELAEQSQKFCDLTIKEADFSKYQDIKDMNKLVQDYDYFIAQANIMPQVAQSFGKTLGIKGKMPNPKLGCVVPPNANLEPLTTKLHASVRLTAKKATNLQCLIGKEDQSDEQIVENILAVYNKVTKKLPQEKHNLKSLQLKLTMSKPVKI